MTNGGLTGATKQPVEPHQAMKSVASGQAKFIDGIAARCERKQVNAIKSSSVCASAGRASLKPPAKPTADSMQPSKRPLPSPDAGSSTQESEREKLLRAEPEDVRNENNQLKQQSIAGICHWPPQTQSPTQPLSMCSHNQTQNGFQPWSPPPQFTQGPSCIQVYGYGMMPPQNGLWNNGAPGQLNNGFGQCNN
jgi:hypothetical protein